MYPFANKLYGLLILFCLCLCVWPGVEGDDVCVRGAVCGGQQVWVAGPDHPGQGAEEPGRHRDAGRNLPQTERELRTAHATFGTYGVCETGCVGGRCLSYSCFLYSAPSSIFVLEARSRFKSVSLLLLLLLHFYESP